MKKFAKILLLIVAVLLMIGVLTYICAYALGGRINLDAVEKMVRVNYVEILQGNIKRADTVQKEISEQYSDVKSIKFAFESSDVIIQLGDNFSITGNSNSTIMESYVDSDGTWIVKQSVDGISLNIGAEDNIFVITIPSTVTLENMELDVKCTNVDVEDVCTKNAEIEVECGKVNYIDGEIDELNVKCEFGSFKYDGLTAKKCNIDCGKGNVNVTYSGNQKDYSYDISMGLGMVRYAGEPKAVIANGFKGGNGSNDININVAAGDVSVEFSK